MADQLWLMTRIREEEEEEEEVLPRGSTELVSPHPAIVADHHDTPAVTGGLHPLLDIEPKISGLKVVEADRLA